jgi:GTPase SAR1 family protein
MNSIFENLKKLLKNELDSYIFNNNPFTGYNFENITLVETPRDNNINTKIFPSKISQFSLAFQLIVDRALGMFEAGKSQKDTYEKIYAYADESEIDYVENIHLKEDGYEILDPDLNNIPVNLDEEYTRKFMVELSRKAQEIRDTKGDIASIKNSRFFILGDVGVGKTTFLNNIFSQYHDNLKDENVFWVRVDLTKPNLSESTLFNALSFQISRIFRAHYFESYDSCDLENFKSTLIKSFNISDKVFNEEEFNECFKDFKSIFDKKRLERFDHRIERGIQEYVESNYGVIYIFDGLDKINSNQNFPERIKEVWTILNHEKFRGIYIFVMRNKSHCELLLQNEIIEQTTLRGFSKILKIIPPKLDEIIDKRINLLLDRSGIYFKEKEKRLYPKVFSITEKDKIDIQKIQQRIIDINKEKYEAYLNVFLLFLNKGISDDFENNLDSWNRKKAFTDLKNLVGNNFRTLLAIITSANKIFLETIGILNLEFEDIIEINNSLGNSSIKNYSNYIEKLEAIQKRSYKIVDILLRRSNYFENPYTYEYSSDGIIRWVNRDIEPENISYIYNLFYSVNVPKTIEPNYYLLLKIRILQYISCNSDLQSKEEVVVYFERTFHYSTNHIDIAFEELVNWGLISLDIKVVYERSIVIFKLSRSGDFHLNNLIKQFNYIRLILDDILIPVNESSLFIDNHFKDNANRKVEFIIRQFPRVINFISMIYAFEICEKEKNKTSDQWFIFPKIYEMIIETFSKILFKDDPDLTILKSVLSIKGISNQKD